MQRWFHMCVCFTNGKLHTTLRYNYSLQSQDDRMLNVLDIKRITFSWFVSEVFLLLRLFDYDRSGLLDGLEMMKLLSDYNSHHAPGAQASEQVRISCCVSTDN